MPAVKVEFRINSKSWASFEGVVEPDGATGYTFSGTLRASTMLDRSSTDFRNTVRLGHGGTADKYSYLDLEIVGIEKENTFPVHGSGTRKKNDTIDFFVGLNDGLSGQFHDGGATTVEAGGPWQSLKPTYISTDSNGQAMYDVRFDGSARADGPTGYVIKGDLDAMEGPGALTTQYATFGYKTDSGSWEYKTVPCKDTPIAIEVKGTRKPGEGIKVVVGATAKVFNLYGYSDEVKAALPENF